MGDEPHHECGFALLRLLKPLEYYEEKYGTRFFGLNRMYLMMEKQRNRGQDGCGVANVKLDMPPGTRYIHCERSIDRDPIKDVFERAQRMAAEKLSRAPPEAQRGAGGGAEAAWVREHVPFAGELFLGHVRYGTDSDNSIDRCHPVMRENNWMTRSLLLAGNFNITNNEDLFSSLVQIGQHPRELSDTVTLLEKIGHFVDKENNDLYVKYSAMGQAPRTCFSLIAETINVARILRKASTDWDGGYCIAGLFGHGDAFVLRDPSGIRPAFYLANDEVVVVASEAPLIQTVFGVGEEQVRPLPPGQAMVVKRSGAWALERVLPALALRQCSFERIYFSRGNDAGVYRERERLGRLLLRPLVRMLEAGGDSLANAVLSFIPNTSELAFNGLAKEAQDEMSRGRSQLVSRLMAQRTTEDGCAALADTLSKMGSLIVRTEKVIHKDAKIRTFIQEDASREHLTVHAYDVHYGTVRAGEDVLVALDDSIVRGNTLKNAILRTLDKLGPKRIIIVSSAPQIRYPDVYGIDMAKMGDLAAFKAAVTLLQETGREHLLREVYLACRAQLARPVSSGDFVNHVKRIYEPFTPEEIAAKIVEQVTPPDCRARVEVLFNSVDALHQAMPDHAGDWYFTGDYPTPGGTKVCCRAFVLWSEGSSARCYGVSSAASCGAPALVLGSGGCEHALAWSLSRSPGVGAVYVAPGNGGTFGQQLFSSGDASDPESRDVAPLIPISVPLAAPSFDEVRAFCREKAVGLVVVGSGELLLGGLADALRADGLLVFGPSRAAAELVRGAPDAPGAPDRGALPAFARRHGVRLAGAAPEPAGAPAGAPAEAPAERERERGVEVSVLAVSDGARYALLPLAVQDCERAPRQDREAHAAGGMGASAPSLLVDSRGLAIIEREVVAPVFDGLLKEDRPFVGCLHFELVLTPYGPKVRGLRCCIGDPVAQVALPLLDCDLFDVFSACAGGRLSGNPLKVRPEMSAVAVVMASGGYPGPFQQGFAISGLERALCVPGAHIFHTGTALEEGRGAPRRKRSRTFSDSNVLAAHTSEPLVTCGGRVLTVVAVGRGLNEARERAYVSVRAIGFTDAWYRDDVGAVTGPPSGGLQSLEQRSEASPSKDGTRAATAMEFTYRGAGVDIAARDAAMASFAPIMKRTRKRARTASRDELVASCDPSCDRTCDISSISKEGQHRLISTTATVGTKLMVASQLGKFDSVGIDLVAHCVNSIAARGAEPLFFQEHLSAERLDTHKAKQLVEGVAHGCIEAGCVLLDSGVAELPGVFAPAGCDFVGFAVGSARPAALLPNTGAMVPGDVLVALPASGLHSNGFSLVRCVIRAAGLEYSQPAPFDPTTSLGEALLPPTRIYVKPVLALAKLGLLRGAVPVASGGLARCFNGVLPPHLAAVLRADAWELPPVFRWLGAVGKIQSSELASTFNCGLGMILVVAKESVSQMLEVLREQREEPVVVGELVPRSPGAEAVEVEGAEGAWLMLPELGVSLPFPEVLSSLHDQRTVTRMRVMVLAGSEEASPLQSLLRATGPASAAELVAVAGPAPGPALALARAAGVKDIALGDGRVKESPQASDFSSLLEETMGSLQAELLVVLDDVDPALLTRSFLASHVGQVAIVHASLLPAFPGCSPIEAALSSGVCVTGCTVCFAVPPAPSESPEHCFGPQILQETLRISEADSAASLRSRLAAECEASCVPRAVLALAAGSVTLRHDGGAYSIRRGASFTEAAPEGVLASVPSPCRGVADFANGC